MKTVFITGASSGIGKETVKVFAKNNWNVIASMRRPNDVADFIGFSNIQIVQFDVTEMATIEEAIRIGINTYGRIDAIINNAGYYAIGCVELATEEQIRRQIETNLIGLINATKAILPYFRKQRSGMIINISSIAGRIAIPLQSLYHATKWGVEGFSESLQYEVQPFNIKVKIIEPGVIKTDFYGRSMTVFDNPNAVDYSYYSKKVINNLVKNGNHGSDPGEVAETIFKACQSRSSKLRYPVGKSKGIITLRNLLPIVLFHRLIDATMRMP